MNHLQKHFSASLIALAALLSTAPMAWAQDLGRASLFSVLGGTNVTCTASVIGGDVGVSPGSAIPFTNTGCTIAGGMPPATNTAAVGARTDFLSAYTALAPTAGDCDVTHTLGATIPASVTLFPGVYCTDAGLTGTDVVLTLDGQGDANAVWIFKIGTNPTGTGALTGTNFSVVMAGGGQACNVFWRIAEAVTMSTSAFKGNILAGGATGSITLTGGTLVGRALANVAVTMTATDAGIGASHIGCGALSGPVTPGTPPGSSFCKDKDYDRHHHGHDHDDDKHHGHDKDGHDDDDGKGHGSYLDNPYDKHDGKSGKSGKK